MLQHKLAYIEHKIDSRLSEAGSGHYGQTAMGANTEAVKIVLTQLLSSLRGSLLREKIGRVFDLESLIIACLPKTTARIQHSAIVDAPKVSGTLPKNA